MSLLALLSTTPFVGFLPAVVGSEKLGFLNKFSAILDVRPTTFKGVNDLTLTRTTEKLKIA